jgi:hypothetical protein
MFLLSFLPDSFLEMVVNAILVAGIVMSFLSFFVINKILNKWPGMSPYYHLLQLVSAVLLIAGVYFKGSYATEAEWRAKVKAAEEQVRIAEQQAAEATTKIETKTVTKTKYIKLRGETIIRDVEREIVKYNNTCIIPPKFIELHNQAAEPPQFNKDSK